MKKLNLGCGYDIKKGFVNADIQENIKGVDKKVDVNKLPLPFKTDEFDYILAKSLLEFCDNPIKVLEELHRISKNQAIIDMTVPYYNSPKSYLNRGFYTTFFEYSKGNKEPYISVKYKVVNIKLIPTLWGKLIPNIPFPKYLGLRHFISTFLGNIIRQIEFKVKVIK